jgi:hypothetical protein
MDAEGGGLTCLFGVADPGPFLWGPQGDRALLDSLAVGGLEGVPTRPPVDVNPEVASWGRPTGKSIVFVAPDGASLLKAHLERQDPTAFEDVSPFTDARYLAVEYHPSGLAFGMVLERPGEEEAIWLSSNVGTGPRRVVFTEEGTTFGDLAFSADGLALFYVAQHSDDHPDLHRIDLTDTSVAPVMWSGPVGSGILDIWAGPDQETVAFTAGKSCADGEAMVRTADLPEGAPLLPEAAGPTRALGWLGSSTVLAAAGPCEGPLDLTGVDVATGEGVPLVLGVDAAAVRTPEPTPPPPLPEDLAGGGGFA